VYLNGIVNVTFQYGLKPRRLTGIHFGCGQAVVGPNSDKKGYMFLEVFDNIILLDH
jgi:hypothetical protein